MKFNLFRHIKDQDDDSPFITSSSEYKYLPRKFRKGKTKSSVECGEPGHRKSGKLLQGDTQMSGAAGAETNINISPLTLERARKAKEAIEKYYADMVKIKQERNERYRKIDQLLSQAALSEEEETKKRQHYAAKESEFLRMTRSKLTVNDFIPLKVIG